MSKLSLIVQKEYMQRVGKKSFLLLTFLMPFLFAAMMFVPAWLASVKSGKTRHIVVIDRTGKYAPLFEDMNTDTDSYRFRHGDESPETYRADDKEEIFAVLSITSDLLQHPDAAKLYSEKQIPQDLSSLVNRVLTKRMEQDKLASFRIPGLEKIVEESRVSFHIQTVKWSRDGSEHASSALIAQLTGTISTVIIYMFILLYGAMVMQGVIEEKTSRIVEIMVSSVRPFELMAGKIIGIGLVGLTQIVLWGIMIGIMLAAGGLFLPPSTQEWTAVLQSFDFAETISYFIIYFAGGYLLYASVFAAIGAAVSAPEDTQQFMAPITVLLVFAMYVGIFSAGNPDSAVAFWCSLIPFTSPVVMMMRIPFEVPLWQKLLSVTLLFAAAVGLTYFAAKIYRVGILMYGKKPHPKEMLKWITFK
ncbi:MAG: ABC transporter permease [Tannerella sp.]|nr:ABC transporter permease [Tannerella sp.]